MASLKVWGQVAPQCLTAWKNGGQMECVWKNWKKLGKTQMDRHGIIPIYTKVKVDGPGGYSIPPWTHQLRLWTTQIFRFRGHLLEAQKRNPRRCAGATNTWRCLCEGNTDITWILLMTLLLPELLQPNQRLLLSASIGRRLG